MIAYVKLRLFTGWPNPSWVLGEAAARKLAASFAVLQSASSDLPPVPPRVGYRGLTLTLVSGETRPRPIEIFGELVGFAGQERFYDAKRKFEQEVYKTAPPEVLRDVGGMTWAQLSEAGNEGPISGLKPPDPPKIGCANGPDPVASKAWSANLGHNNCYNFANDVLNTDEFTDYALPGSFTKVPANISTAALKTKLRAALTADGLVRVTTDKVPAACPGANKHYVAIIIRHHPGSSAVKDFHCLRLDKDGTWYHKDNSGEPRNTDDNLNVITDLTQAQFNGNAVLVGIYRAKRNNPKIK